MLQFKKYSSVYYVFTTRFPTSFIRVWGHVCREKKKLKIKVGRQMNNAQNKDAIENV